MSFCVTIDIPKLSNELSVVQIDKFSKRFNLSSTLAYRSHTKFELKNLSCLEISEVE